MCAKLLAWATPEGAGMPECALGQAHLIQNLPARAARKNLEKFACLACLDEDLPKENLPL
jgi:hypothetical protein